MREKKFPVIPVSILGVAVVGGAIMISNKPLVGDMEEVMKAKYEREQAAKAQASSEKISGDSRTSVSDAQLKKELDQSLKTSEAGTNAGVRRPQVKTPLIKSGVRQKVDKVTPNDGIPATGWYNEQYRGDKK